MARVSRLPVFQVMVRDARASAGGAVLLRRHNLRRRNAFVLLRSRSIGRMIFPAAEKTTEHAFLFGSGSAHATSIPSTRRPSWLPSTAQLKEPTGKFGATRTSGEVRCAAHILALHEYFDLLPFRRSR